MQSQVKTAGRPEKMTIVKVRAILFIKIGCKMDLSTKWMERILSVFLNLILSTFSGVTPRQV